MNQKSIEWRFDIEAGTVEIQGQAFLLLPITADERNVFGYKMDRQDAIRRSLLLGKLAFEEGRAEYQEAERRLSDLMDALSTAMMNLNAHCQEIALYLADGGPEDGQPHTPFAGFFEGKLEELLRFSREWRKNVPLAEPPTADKVPDAQEDTEAK